MKVSATSPSPSHRRTPQRTSKVAAIVLLGRNIQLLELYILSSCLTRIVLDILSEGKGNNCTTQNNTNTCFHLYNTIGRVQWPKLIKQLFTMQLNSDDTERFISYGQYSQEAEAWLYHRLSTSWALTVVSMGIMQFPNRYGFLPYFPTSFDSRRKRSSSHGITEAQFMIAVLADCQTHACTHVGIS